jgi:hypothetical protein
VVAGWPWLLILHALPTRRVPRPSRFCEGRSLKAGHPARKAYSDSKALCERAGRYYGRIGKCRFTKMAPL